MARPPIIDVDEQTQRAVDALAQLSPRQRRIAQQLITAHGDTASVSSVREVCAVYQLPERRFDMSFTSARSFIRSHRRTMPDNNTAIRAMIPTDIEQMCIAFANLYRFVDKTFASGEEAGLPYRMRLDIWLIEQSYVNYERHVMYTRKEDEQAYNWTMACRMIGRPYLMANVAFPNCTASGVWLGIAKKIVGLAENVHDTLPTNGNVWLSSPDPFPDFLRKEEEAERSSKAYHKRVEELASRPKPGRPRMPSRRLST